MASFMKKTMAYLGLVDDDYDDYDDYDTRGPAAMARVAQRPPVEDVEPVAQANRIRALGRDDVAPVAMAPAGSAVSPRPATVRPLATEPVSARVHVVAPARFADAQEIGMRLKDNQPVIVNLQHADRDLQRRMIDFCSGVTYALSGGMERVADEVFLLTPSNVKVSDEERQRLQERGLVNP